MKKQILEKMVTLSTAAFGLVAALAWNEAVKALFVQMFGASEGLAAMFGYAIAVTAIAVFITLWLGKMAEKIK